MFDNTINILLTGPPACGKSTVIEALVRQLRLPCTGFYTLEIRSRGRRAGFGIRTLDGRYGVMAHVDIRSRHRVGRYGVDSGVIDRFAVPSLIPDDNRVVVVIDDIGKMECFSRAFRRQVLDALDSANIVVGTIALKGGGFITAVKQRPDIRIVTVTRQNRDGLAAKIVACLPGGRQIQS